MEWHFKNRGQLIYFKIKEHYARMKIKIVCLDGPH